MKWIIITFVVVFIAIVSIPQVIWSNDRHEYTITIDSKDRTAKPKGGSDQRVYTKDDQIFNVGDDWINGQWNSSDLYAKIEPGHTYKVETAGWRNGFFSQFPNIYEIQEEN